MGRTVVINQSGLKSLRDSRIRLTQVTVAGEVVAARDALEVNIHDLLGYSEHRGFTRLYLRGGRALDVSEGSAVIDRLVSAATLPFPRQQAK